MSTSPLNFVKEGRGPTVVLSHALGCDLHMWDAVAAILRTDFTVLRYDHRGHGASPVVPGAVTIEALADDVALLIREQVAGTAHFVGLSMGGMTAQALAVRAPELLHSIVIANSSSHYPDPSVWHARVARVRAGDMAGVAGLAVPRWFTPGFRVTPEGAAAEAALKRTLLATDPQAYAESCLALAGIDFRESNRRITIPTLVLAGTVDEATPPAMSKTIADAIPGALLRTLETAHISAAEQPAAFAALVRSFVTGQGV